MYAPSTQMDEYLDLIRAFPLVSLRDERHLTDAVGVLHQLLDVPERSTAQEAYLGALGDIIEAFENAHVYIPAASGLQVLRHLMEENDLKQKDMDFAFGNKAVTSAVMGGTRPIGLAHARRLSARFALPLDVFLAPQDQVPDSTEG